MYRPFCCKLHSKRCVWSLFYFRNYMRLCAKNGATVCSRIIVITGSIARSAKRRLFKLLRGQFWGFSPRKGDILHRWSEIWHGGVTITPCQISPHRRNDNDIGHQTLKILLKFHQISKYKRPTGAYLLRDFLKRNLQCLYTVSQKSSTLTMAITLSILGGFAKFFHCCKQQ